jgi:hypothetical protein
MIAVAAVEWQLRIIRSFGFYIRLNVHPQLCSCAAVPILL